MSGALQIEVEESPKWQDFWRATGRVPFALPGFGSLFTTAIDKCVGLCWRTTSVAPCYLWCCAHCLSTSISRPPGVTPYRRTATAGPS